MRGWLLVPALVALAVAYALADRDSGLLRWWHLRGELDDARGRIATRHAEIDELRDEVSLLEDDEFAIERAIREDLALARPGETLVRWGRADASNVRFP